MTLALSEITPAVDHDRHRALKLVFAPVLASLLVLALCGCEGMRYTQFSGQGKAWPTGSAFTDKAFDVPVFKGWPEKSYDVLGHIAFANPNIDWNDGDMEQAARMASQSGGDAILLLLKGDVSSPSMVSMRSDLGISADQTVAVVLKWKQ
jgi:hypothetical protein